MFTPQQFTQLAAAAWPCTGFRVTSTTAYSGSGLGTTTTYSLTYCGSGGGYADCFSYSGEGATIFEAAACAIEQAWASWAMQQAVYLAALAAIEQAEQAWAAPATSAAQVTCAACGQGRDLLSECGCSYVPVPASRYFHE